jgi:tetratricopeptide (TPR) repeat protein
MILLHAMSSALLLLSDPSALIASGDDAFLRIRYDSARSAYVSALEASPRDPEILWRMARLYVCMGEVAEDSIRGRLFRRAEEYARESIALDPDRPEAHTWLAGALGYVAYYSSSREQVGLVREVLQETDRAVALDPNDDAAYSIRGSTYRALGSVGWFKRRLASLFLGSIPEGGYEEGEAALKRAIEIAPDVMRHRYELAVLYLDWGKRGEARTVLLEAEKLPVRVAIDRPRLEKIRELLREPPAAE